MKGYCGKLLEIDLTNETSKEFPLKKTLLKKFIGGRGLGSKLIYDLLPPHVDPLSPENIMLILTGPLTGSAVPGSGKFVVITKSPVSGGFVDSYSSGRFAPELKFCGYDGLIIRGKAKEPMYVNLQNGKVEFTSARELWGKDTFDTEEQLREIHGTEIGCICIGPGGENLVKFASINSDFYRQAARGGVGTVMGSKKLKAIVALGHQSISCHDSKGLMELLNLHLTKLFQSPVAQNRMKYGTPSTLDVTNAAGMLPTHNFQSGHYEKAKDTLDSEGVYKNIVKSRGCYDCQIACGIITQAKSGLYEGVTVEGPEYETLGLFGPNIGNSYLPAILQANILCDKLGIDTISAANSIAFAMECFERGIIDKKQTNGVELNFGNYEAALDLIESIAYRAGIGDILAEGVNNAAKAFGQDSEDFAMQVKGLEFPAYDPRVGYGTALSYAVSPRGACHRRAWPPALEVLGKDNPYSTENKAKLVKHLADENTVFHSALVCDFPAKWIPLEVKEYAKYLTFVTGEQFDEEQLWLMADRVETQIRLFNTREGLKRQDDTLPRRIFKEGVVAGPTQGRFIPYEALSKMLDDYYALRGWDNEGFPTEDTRKRLGLIDGGEA
jgi:aldehyde:ferredoxin oxidoreductase